MKLSSFLIIFPTKEIGLVVIWKQNKKSSKETLHILKYLLFWYVIVKWGEYCSLKHINIMFVRWTIDKNSINNKKSQNIILETAQTRINSLSFSYPLSLE